MKYVLGGFICFFKGHLKPKRLVQVEEISLPRGTRFAMMCSRCGDIPPISVAKLSEIADLQRKIAQR